jgi:hypothetical protein
MKNKIILFVSILCSTIVYSQEEKNKFADIKLEKNSESVTYIFESNYFIGEFKAPLKENRIKFFFPFLKTISINCNTQLVSVTFPLELTDEEIIKLIYHFQYTTYEIN